MTDAFEWFVGIDWGSEAHALCLLDATGQIRGTRHRRAYGGRGARGAALGARADRGGAGGDRRRDRDAARARWSIPSSSRASRLCAESEAARSLSRSVHGRRRQRRRPRCAASLADALRTDRRAFRRVRADDPLIIQLREADAAAGGPAGRRTATRQSLARSALSRRCAVADAQPGGRRAVAVDPAGRGAGPDRVGAALAAPPGRGAARASHSPRDRRRDARGAPAAAPDGRAGRHRRRSPHGLPRWCRNCRSSPSSAWWPNGRSIGCSTRWPAARRPTRSRASIVTSRFSSPCPGSEEW